MKNMPENHTSPACWKHISDRDLITETMRDKGMTRAEAFRWLYQCTAVVGNDDVKGGKHG